MNVIKNIQQEIWSEIIKRPTIENKKLTTTVSSILSTVKSEKDKALQQYTVQFDKVNLKSFIVSNFEIEQAIALVSKELKEAINVAKGNIEKFHNSQKSNERIIETTTGVKCWRKNVAIEKVGLYIPGGSAPLFSTILMLGIPAKIAGIHGVELYDIKMENAVIIRKAAQEIITNLRGLQIAGFREVEYLELLRREIEVLRPLFAEWVKTFNPYNYIIDRWGLFNPPGVDYNDKMPGYDLPYDNNRLYEYFDSDED